MEKGSAGKESVRESVGGARSRTGISRQAQRQIGELYEVPCDWCAGSGLQWNDRDICEKCNGFGAIIVECRADVNNFFRKPGISHGLFRLIVVSVGAAAIAVGLTYLYLWRVGAL